MATINWTMSAALENIERGGNELPEVTNLRAAVLAWMGLDNELQNEAVLTPESPVELDGETIASFSGQAIRALAERLEEADG